MGTSGASDRFALGEKASLLLFVLISGAALVLGMNFL
jgi:hypothetical protein